MYVGLDIGGTKTELAVFTPAFERLEVKRITTETHDYEVFIESTFRLIEEASVAHGGLDIIGVGMPGLRDKQGHSLCSNLPAANKRNVKDDLSARLGRDIVIENDCRCFALSEANGGAAAGYKTVYGAILGTGAGGGLVIDGKLLPTRQSIAGEYGHQALPAHLQRQYELDILNGGSGLAGALENYISGPGLSNIFRQFSTRCATPEEILDAASQGDGDATRALECHLDLVGYAVAQLVMYYDPDAIVMGGGISLIEGLIDQLPLAAETHLFERFNPPPILKAKFGDSSGARGAAILAKQVLDG